MEMIYSDFKKLNKLMTTYSFIHRHKSNTIKIGVIEMTVNDSEMCMCDETMKLGQ